MWIAPLLAGTALAEPTTIHRADLPAELAKIRAAEDGSVAVGGDWDTNKEVAAAVASGSLGISALRVNDMIGEARVEMAAELEKSGLRCGWLVVQASPTVLRLFDVGVCKPVAGIPPAPVAVAAPPPPPTPNPPAAPKPAPVPAGAALDPGAAGLLAELMAMPDHPTRQALLVAKLSSSPEPAAMARLAAVLGALGRLQESKVTEPGAVRAAFEAALRPVATASPAPPPAAPAAKPKALPALPPPTDPLTHAVVKYSDIADGRSATLEEGFIGAYETQFGYTIARGDVIAVHTPTGSSMRGTVSGVGANTQSLSAGVGTAVGVRSNWFANVYNGTYSATVGKMVGLGLAAGLAGQALDPALFMAPASLSGAEIRVIRMKLGGTRNRPVVWMECELLNTKEKANFSGIITIADYDTAMRSGEIYNPNFITRDIAVARLLEARNLLEIGVYTQAQFDAMKAKYGPYVAP